MNIESLRDYCISKANVEETFPFGDDTLVFKVGGKIFLLCGLDKPDRFNVKCDPERAILLREEFDEVHEYVWKCHADSYPNHTSLKSCSQGFQPKLFHAFGSVQAQN